MERITTLVNSCYLDRDTNFPRQQNTLRKLEAEQKHRGYATDVVKIAVLGRDTLEITENIAQQIREIMGHFYNGSVVNFTGDSLCPLVMQAMQKNLERFPVTTDLSLDPRPVILAPGGTMNLLPKELGTDRIETVAAMACGLYPFQAQKINLRSTTIRTFDHDSHLVHKQSHPWTSFAGARLDGYIMQQMEQTSRKRYPLARMIETAGKTILHSLRRPPRLNLPASVKDKLPLDFGIVSYLTIPSLGPYRFDHDDYNTLHRDCFHRIVIEGDAGLDAIMKWLTFSSLATNPPLGKQVWDRINTQGNCKTPWYRFSEIIPAIKPQIVKEDLRFYNFNDPYLEIDGYPVDMTQLGLRPDGYATTYTTTSEKSFIAARAATPEQLD